MRVVLIILFSIFCTKLFANDSLRKADTYVKKYNLALNGNAFLKGNNKDNNIYTYSNFYNSKNDFFIYLDYFHRVKKDQSIMKYFSLGFFYDRMITKRTFSWNFYQGEFIFNSSWKANQLASGVGFYAINNKKCYLTINNGLLYKNISDETSKNEFRYLFRIKSRLIIGKTYVETYNYFQPLFSSPKDLNFITFNTFTCQIYKTFNFKVYHWLSTNTVTKTPFQYIIFGFSLENWK